MTTERYARRTPRRAWRDAGDADADATDADERGVAMATRAQLKVQVTDASWCCTSSNERRELVLKHQGSATCCR
jgi:hypothetical protein